MVVISGRNSEGNDVTMFGNRIMVGELANLGEILERKTISNKVNKLVISGNMPLVNISSADVPKVIVTLEGFGNFDASESLLSVFKSDKSAEIKIKLSGNYFAGKLNIVVPSDKFYDLIKVTSKSGSIVLDSSVKSKRLKLATRSGNIEVITECKNLHAVTTSGRINAKLAANSNSSIDLNTMSGDIDLGIYNVANVQTSLHTIYGTVINNLNKLDDGHSADVSIFSISGHIRII